MSEQQGTTPPGHPTYDHLHLFGGGPPAGGRRPDSRRRTATGLAIAMVAVAVLGIGGAMAWRFWFGQGPQPAEALPADTIGYVAVDLDPSGKQKVAALRTLRKFPALRDLVSIGDREDVRERLLDEAQGEGICTGVDYGRDVAPWLGDRMAAAALPRAPGEVPEPVVVLQVHDAEAAEEGIAELLSCAPDVAREVTGHAVDGQWMVLARTQEAAEQALADAADSSLADHDEFRDWVGRTGDPGIVTGYLAPSFGDVMEQAVRSGAASSLSDGLAPGDQLLPADPADLPEHLLRQLADFGGGAFTVRFDGGAVELESVADGSHPLLLALGEGTGDLLGPLPRTTAGALGLSLADGWWDAALAAVGPMVEGQFGRSTEELLAEVESASGLSLPEDLVDLLGDSVVVVVDGAMVGAADGSGAFPFSVRLRGDADRTRAVLEKLLARFWEVPLVVRTDGDEVLVGLDDAHLAELAGAGAPPLRAPGSERAAAAVHLDFDVAGWLERMFAWDPALAANLAPLDGLRVAVWTDDVAHLRVRLTTD